MLAVPSNLIFSRNSVPFRRTSEWVILRHTEFPDRSIFCNSSLFREISLEHNFDGNPSRELYVYCRALTTRLVKNPVEDFFPYLHFVDLSTYQHKEK